MREPEATSPFLRVPSRYEKWSELVFNVLFSWGSIAVVFWALDADFKLAATWMCSYGALFFGVNALHAWRSIKNRWNIAQCNEDFHGPRVSWTTNKWLLLAILLGWLAARQWQ